MKKYHLIIFILISALAILGNLYSLGFFAINKPVQLDEVEVTEYKGERMTPISDVPSLNIKGTQVIDIKDYKLKITGFVENSVSYSYNEIIKNHQNYVKPVKLICITGWDAKILWEGVLVYDLLSDAGVSKNANTVIFKSSDGYTTSLPLEYVKEEKILLAYKMNGITLPSEYGFPFRIVAEAKYGYKWAKWVTEIEVSDNSDYRGYWEERGFSNEADIEHP